MSDGDVLLLLAVELMVLAVVLAVVLADPPWLVRAWELTSEPFRWLVARLERLLLCRLLRRHQPLTVFDRVVVDDVSEDSLGISVTGRVTRSHVECRHCRRPLPGRSTR